MLLLGFTVSFIIDGISDAQQQDDDGDAVNGWIVLWFALGGLLFDSISLLSYKFFAHEESDPKKELLMDDSEGMVVADELTCERIYKYPLIPLGLTLFIHRRH